MQYDVSYVTRHSRIRARDRDLRLKANAPEKTSTVPPREIKKEKKMKPVHHFQVGYIHNPPITFYLAVYVNNFGNNLTTNAYSLRVSIFPYENYH